MVVIAADCDAEADADAEEDAAADAEEDAATDAEEDADADADALELAAPQSGVVSRVTPTPLQRVLAKLMVAVACISRAE